MHMYAFGSSSSSLSTSEKYDVFLSFRGEDTRDKFTSHLFAALDRKKIKTFIDEKSLERGHQISPSLLEAIQKAKISIIVFSKGYASSSFCLSELVHILECYQTNKQIVIPIFYEVDPSHIRKQEGSYGEAFLKHEKCFKHNMDIVQKWRAALRESASLSGWDSRVTRPESKLVEAVVEDVLRKLNRDQPLNLGFEGLIGIDKQIEEIKLLLRFWSPKVRIVGIWGMGGIGKTTLAQVMYDQLSSQFESRCFVANVREESEKGSLINLRNKLLAELLKEENQNMENPSLGPSFVKERLQRTKVLIVLDDVNHVEQLELFIGDRDQFSCESRIIITTRDAAVLRNISADGIYEVKQLDFDEASELFKSKAFEEKENSPIADYAELLQKVVKYAGGNPLAIKVLGSYFRSLRSQKKENWEMALDKLKVMPHKDIQSMLRVSYDGLEDTEKNIFLDIACFFKGKYRDYVENMLNACGFFANNGIDELIDKSLITVDYFNLIWMHDLLEEMGRKIVCEESAELGERSRLWIADDACHVLENNEGTAKIQGIFLDLSKRDEEMHLEPTIFKKMHNLRFLKIYYSSSKSKKCKVYLQHGLQHLPRSLRYLQWEEYPLKSLPPNFRPKNLVELTMPYSQLEQLWDGFQDLDKLRSVNLGHSVHLIQIPNLSGAANLERINLESCKSLLLVPSHNLLNLNKLINLNLSSCNKLQSLPDRIDAASLKYFYLEGCSSLNNFPMTISGGLVSIDLSSTAIISLPSSIDSLNNLFGLSLNNCTSLVNLPSSMNKLDSLDSLSLSGCSNLEKFPELPRNISSLDISGTAIKEVTSSSIEHRYRLWTIKLSNCRSLESLPTSIFNLKSLVMLHLDGCSNLKNLPEISEPIEKLKHLYLTGSGIRKLPSSIGHLIGIEELNLYNCENLALVPSSICNMTSLRHLYLSNCPKLEYVFPTPADFLRWDLLILCLNDTNIFEIPDSIKGLPKLAILSVDNCKNLQSLPELPLSLEFLHACGCESLEVVSNSKRALTQEFWDDYCIEEPWEYLFFSDCLKLDKSELHDIIIEFQLRILRKVVRLDYQNMESRVGAFCPGNEIPNWFEYQAEGSFIDIKLPPQWRNSNFLGLVVCAVGDPYSGTRMLDLLCEFNLKTNLGENHKFTWEFTNWEAWYDELPTKSNSCHLYMWYHHFDYSKCVDVEEALFHFLFKELKEGEDATLNHAKNEDAWIESSKCEVKKCGIHMLYRHNLSFGNI